MARFLYSIFLILATYIFYPKLNKEKLIKIELEKPENIAKMNERLGEWAGSKLGKSEEEKKTQFEINKTKRIDEFMKKINMLYDEYHAELYQGGVYNHLRKLIEEAKKLK